MRHFHSIITGAVCALILGASLPSCVSKAEYESQYEELEGRVAKLETMCSRMQNNLNFMTVMMIGCARTLLALGVSFDFFIWALVFSTIPEEMGLSPCAQC